MADALGKKLYLKKKKHVVVIIVIVIVVVIIIRQKVSIPYCLESRKWHKESDNYSPLTFQFIITPPPKKKKVIAWCSRGYSTNTFVICSLIKCLTDSSFVNIFSKYLHYQTVRAKDLTF